MTTEYAHPIAPNIFSLLEKLCDITARELHLIAGTESSIEPAERADVDSFFEVPGQSIAGLTEEINQAIALHVCEYLHGLKRLLSAPIVTPGVIAPLAFTSIKTSSQLKFINEFEWIDRAVWTLRSINEKSSSPDELNAVKNLPNTLTSAIRNYEAKAVGGTQAFPDDRTLVCRMLEWDSRSDVFEFLQSYSDELVWSGLKHRMYLPGHTEFLELSSVDILLDTLTSANIAAHHLAMSRDRAKVAQSLNILKEASGAIRELRTFRSGWLEEWGDRHKRQA